MNSLWIALGTIPVATLVIGTVYRTQYRVGAVARAALVAAHFVAVCAIIATYWLLCYQCYAPTAWQFVGWPVFVAGSALFWCATFSHPACLVPDASKGVSRTGPYRWVRHPIYSGGLLGALGLVAVAPSLQTALAWLMLAASLWALLRDEENELRARVGEPYAAYCRTTRRLIPWVL